LYSSLFAIERLFMFLRSFEINLDHPVRDIVAKDYRTALVFRKHGITYCCGGKWPLEIACQARGVDAVRVKEELETVSRTLHSHAEMDYASWDLNFLVDYLINIHHAYAKRCLPELKPILHEFVEEHVKKYPYLQRVERKFTQLADELLAAIQSEEELVFPYIRQLSHIYRHKESYAALLIRTLRQPVEEMMNSTHTAIAGIISSLREQTSKYETPENACISHAVVLAKLKELDSDIAQHIFLEQKILFPKVAAIEKELMEQ
jgi:regulator of cell morphogenesis and NO signaling